MKSNKLQLNKRTIGLYSLFVDFNKYEKKRCEIQIEKTSCFNF